MKFTRKSIVALWIVGLPLLCVAGLIVSGFLVPSRYATTQTAERSFVIPEDFTKVRKILVRTNAAKDIVTMGGGSEFIDQTWSESAVNAEGEGFSETVLRNLISKDPDWRLELQGTLRVRTQDDYIGKSDITLDQTVEIIPDRLESQVKLREGTERLLEYKMTTRFLRDESEGTTRIEQQLTQRILTDAPWFAHGIADRRVRESVEKSLLSQEAAIRQVVEKNKDQSWLFPLY